MKICSECYEEKGLLEFYKNKNYADGYQVKCKACVNALHKAYVKNNKEKVNALQRKSQRKYYKTLTKEQKSKQAETRRLRTIEAAN